MTVSPAATNGRIRTDPSCLPLEEIPPHTGEMSAKRTKGFTSPLKEKVAAKPSDEVENKCEN